MEITFFSIGWGLYGTLYFYLALSCAKEHFRYVPLHVILSSLGYFASMTEMGMYR
jgi:hypothetical protein